MRPPPTLPTELSLPSLGGLSLGPFAGSGGAAWVFRASRRRRPRDAGHSPGQGEHDLALKISREADDAAIARLCSEATGRAICGALLAPLDGGFVTFAGGTHPVLAFPWIEGVTLARFSCPQALSPTQLLAVVERDVGAMLARLHLLGFRHGDVKPENIVIQSPPSSDGAWRAILVDFSLAAPFSAPLTGATPQFLPPEVLGNVCRAPERSSRRATHSTSKSLLPTPSGEADVFALGRVLEITADRLAGGQLSDLARLALSKEPGDRPAARAFACWGADELPLDAAYIVTRLREVERAALTGMTPPLGPASAWVGGLMRTLAGLHRVHRVHRGDRVVLASEPLPALKGEERRRLLARIAGEGAQSWSLGAWLDDEASFLTALDREKALGRSLSPRDLNDQSKAWVGELGESIHVAIASAVAAVTLRPGDERSLSHLAHLAQLVASRDDDLRLLDENVGAATVTLLRRAGRITEVIPLASALASLAPTLSRVLDAAELFRLSGNAIRAGALLDQFVPVQTGQPSVRAVSSDSAEVGAHQGRLVALRARIRIDEGDGEGADAVLAEAIDLSSADEAALAEVRALRHWNGGRFAEGLREIDAVDHEEPERRARLLVVRGMLEHGRGDAAAALRDFARAADLALALATPLLEASARASAAAAAHDAGFLGTALDAANRAIALLDRSERFADAARARLNRSATLLALGATTEAIAEARRTYAIAQLEGDGRTAAYARWLELDAVLSSASALVSNVEMRMRLSRDAIDALGAHPSASDSLQSTAYQSLAGNELSAASVSEGDRRAAEIEPPSARWTWWRARLQQRQPSPSPIIDQLIRAADSEAPPWLVGSVLVEAVAVCRRDGRGEASRTLCERLFRLVDRVSGAVPLSYRASFEASPWVTAARHGMSADRGDGEDARDGGDVYGLSAGQIELLNSISQSLRDRTSLSDLLRQVVDGLVLWVGA
ncbi:MAG: hypothetical protein NVSMB1_12550 [Polyangiales bacterium]